MVIDFNEYAKKKAEERAKIEADAARELAEKNLARAYATKGLATFFEARNMEWSEEDAEPFIPLMEEAVAMGLSGAQIEEVLISVLEEENE